MPPGMRSLGRVLAKFAAPSGRAGPARIIAQLAITNTMHPNKRRRYHDDVTVPKADPADPTRLWATFVCKRSPAILDCAQDVVPAARWSEAYLSERLVSSFHCLCIS